MNKNWNACIIVSVICRLLGIATILGFVAFMVVLTNKLGCLWLLWLLFVVDFIPTYEIKSKPIQKETEDDQNH